MKNDMTLSLNYTPFFHVVSDPLLVIDGDGLIVNSNSIAQRVFNLKPGSSFFDRLTNKDEFIACLDDDFQIKSFEGLGFQLTKEKHIDLKLSISNLPSPTNQDNEKHYVLTLEQEISDLDVLKETVKLHDQRVEKLSRRLSEVSQELLQRTIQLAEQKNTLKSIIFCMNEGLLACDDQGMIIQCNESAKQLLNLPDESTNRHLAEVCQPLDDALKFDPNNPHSFQQRVFDFSLDKRDLRVSCSPIHEKEDCVTGLVMIFEDRTKQAEIDRMKADLISIVSHELRSPLTSIKGYIDLMISGDLGEISDEMAGYLKIISTNANRLAALIDDLLDLDRIESGKLNMTFGKVDVRYLCDYVYLTMKPQAEQKNINFVMDVKPGLAVSGDVDRLQQALTNLVSNAIKYTPESGEVRITTTVLNNHRVHISVKDNGIGISAEDQKKLFQRFFRVKTKATRNIGGTGLGLSISKSIVEAQEGAVYVESKEGEGSTFTIDLPIYHS